MPTSPGPLLQALDALWQKIRAKYRELPAAQIVITPSPPRADHGPERWVWVDETTVTGLVVSAETLDEGAEAVATFFLHEAAHLLCWDRGIKDTTMRGAYHNASYLAAAEEVGLVWPDGLERIKGRGYSAPVLSDAARLHTGDLSALADAIAQSLPHLTAPAATSTQRRTSRIALQCQCNPPRRITVAPTIADLGPIHCGVCGAEFKA
ncbi:hypothetical protein [Streptomyces sp. NPDC058272]|uniref:hypothetical protein n=1 Tax=Streptomyces sp. NPDC058272 TaxID=3346415 RepID=UPI0036ED8A57